MRWGSAFVTLGSQVKLHFTKYGHGKHMDDDLSKHGCLKSCVQVTHLPLPLKSLPNMIRCLISSAHSYSGSAKLLPA